MLSPVVDMDDLITNMMQWANVSEAQLKEVGEISTDFDETLSWLLGEGASLPLESAHAGALWRKG